MARVHAGFAEIAGPTGPLRGSWRCRDTLRLGTVGILGGWALQGYSAAGYCKDTWWLGTAGILGGKALQRMLCGWALQGFSAVEHCMNTPGNGRGQH